MSLLQSTRKYSRYILEHYSQNIKEELLNANNCTPVSKDIIIVVHNQLECIKNCINSIRRNTKNYHIYLWDNYSDEDTASFLRDITKNDDVSHLEICKENLGFIIPNNRLVSMGNSPYVILLNSDTIVRLGWDEVMISWLQTHQDIAAVGYGGGLLNENMVGESFGVGYNIDYLSGWCLCFSRKIFQEFGLFDESNLQFAYGEDSDFSFRLRAANKKIYAVHADLVLHLRCQTSQAVAQTKSDMKESFEANHTYLRRRWGGYFEDRKSPKE